MERTTKAPVPSKQERPRTLAGRAPPGTAGRERSIERRADVVAGALVVRILEVAARSGLDPNHLVRGLPIEPAALTSPETTISWTLASAIVERATRLTRRCLGCEVGMTLSPLALGPVGVAMASAPTLKDSVEVMLAYGACKAPIVAGTIATEEDEGVLRIVEQRRLGPAREPVLRAAVIGFWRCCRLITGRPLAASAALSTRPPAHRGTFAALGIDARFESSDTTVRFDRRFLELVPPMADSITYRGALRACEALLEQSALGLEARVGALAIDAAGAQRSLDEVATLLGVSPRTLKRRLAECGETFSTLKSRRRHEHAARLLKTTTLSIAEVAQRAGYTDPANFSRAFRAQMGARPTALRASARGGAGSRACP